MADENRIDVTIYPSKPVVEISDEEGREVEIVPLEFSDVNYISFVSAETYGIPALISEDKVKNEIPVKILYVFPANIVAMEAERTA